MGTSFIHSASGPNFGAVVGSDGRLYVDAAITSGSISITTGDIQLGAVELKDQNGTDRASIIGSALWSHAPPSAFTTGSIGAITSGTNATVLTKLFAGSTLLWGWTATSTADSQITLVKDATRIETQRISIFFHRNIQKTFLSPLVISAGSVFVQAVHGEGVSQGYEASIFYKEI